MPCHRAVAEALEGWIKAGGTGDDSKPMDVLTHGIDDHWPQPARGAVSGDAARSMAERGIDQERYAWYRDLRRYGTVPHAGFGLGFERTMAYVTGLSNVRDAIPFPRTPGNARY